MKKYTILLYVLLGVFLSFFLQDTLSKETFASDVNNNKNYKVEEDNRPSFIKASEHAIKAVVHIKSKYISNEIYGYYDPFYGKRFLTNQKKILQAVQVLLSQKMDILLLIDMLLIMLKR